MDYGPITALLAFSLRPRSANGNKQEFMTERESNTAPDHDRTSPRKDGEIIPGQHGKHGGSMESEGAPQKGTREANEQSKSNEAGRRDDGA